MTVDDLWFLADEARQRAEQAYHASGSATRISLSSRATATSRGVGSETWRPALGITAHLTAHTRSPTDPAVNSCSSATRASTCGSSPAAASTDDEGFTEAARRELAEESGIEATTRDWGCTDGSSFTRR